jgi:tetratricopeptide (TPR) repeat protein
MEKLHSEGRLTGRGSGVPAWLQRAGRLTSHGSGVPAWLLRAAVFLAAAAVSAALSAAAAGPAQAGGARHIADQGNQAYEAGNFSAAATRYQLARELEPDAPVLYFNMGAALYQQDNYEAALNAFQSLDTQDDRLASLNHYNQGNTLARLGQSTVADDPVAALELYHRAVSAYKRALNIQPGFSEAAYNIEVVRYWIADLEELIEQLPRSGSSGEGDPSESTEQGDSQGGEPGEQSPQDQGPQQEGDPGDESPDSGGAPTGPTEDMEDPGPPRNETAQSILEEEQRRREEQARAGGERSSYDRPTW